MWYKCGNRRLFFWSADLVACVLRSGKPVSVIFSHFEISHAKMALKKCSESLSKGHTWMSVYLLIILLASKLQLLWSLKILHCFMFVSLFAVLASEDWLSPYFRGCLFPIPIFVRFDNNIACGIRGVDTKYQNQCSWGYSIYIQQCNYNV